MKGTIKKSKIALIILYIIMFGCEHCFYLIDEKAINVAGAFNLSDIFLAIGLMFFAYVELKYRRVSRIDRKYKILVASITVLIVTSSYQSHVLYGQSILYGIRPQRFWIVWAFMVFPISKLLYARAISTKDIENLIYRFGYIELLLYSLQFIWGSGVEILHVNTSGVLLHGLLRYYFDSVLLRLMLFLSIEKIFRKQHILKNSIIVALDLFVIVIVCQMRMTFIAVAVSIVIGVMLMRRMTIRKILMLAGIVLVAAFSLNLSVVQETITEAMGFLQGNAATTSTLKFRAQASALYMNTLASHPLLGGGYINTLNDVARNAAGIDNNIYLVDNGLLAFVYIYGLIGLAWLVVLAINLLRDGYYLVKKYEYYCPLLFVIALFAAGRTEAHWYWHNGFMYMTLIITMMIGKRLENKNGTVKNIVK